MPDAHTNPLRFLPVALDLHGKRCLVIGGGTIGTRKVTTLLRAGAEVVVVSPDVTDDLSEHINAGRVRWEQGRFNPESVDGVFLAIAATDDVSVNTRLVTAARQCGALVCDASAAERSDVIFGALHETDEITLAVFTDGRDPARARRARDQLAQLLADDESATFKP